MKYKIILLQIIKVIKLVKLQKVKCNMNNNT